MDISFDITTLDIDTILKELEEIAGPYEDGTKEKKALETAAYAILFLSQESVLKKFRQYLRKCREPLSDKQRKHLKKMGILT